ncbi:MAG TPA: hypothetical protein VGO57_07095 [Verrucomicrobiae bacterium]|jgi:hypothetical protein
MNLPEEQLSSWRPRRPSDGLKRRIFAGATESTTLAARWLWGALTPAMACLMLTVMMLNSGNDAIHTKPVLMTVLSNQSFAFNGDTSGQMAQNHLASVTFDWTNHSGFNSSMRFTPTTNLSN